MRSLSGHGRQLCSVSSIFREPLRARTSSRLRQIPSDLRAHSCNHRPSRTPATQFSRALHQSPKSSTSGIAAQDDFHKILKSNAQWRADISKSDPELLPKLAQGQSPHTLWIGCSDSRCPETSILNLKPGEVFVHRNIANILTNTDLSSLSVIEYGVEHLFVKHIVVCGHTSCGGVAAALDNKKIGLIDTWLMPLRAVRNRHLEELDALPAKEQWAKLVELNVKNSVRCVLENPVVIQAMRKSGLKVHGLVYDIGTGELNEVDCSEDDAGSKDREACFNLFGGHVH